MTDKIQKIRQEVEKLKSNLLYGACASQVAMENRCKEEAYNEVLAILDNTQEEPVSEDLEEASKNYALNNTPWDDCKDEIQESFKAGAKWQKTKDESTTEDLGEYIDKLSKQFPEVSFAKLSRIAVRVAKWQKEHLWKPADGDDLPEIDREVIALTQPYPNDEHLKVVFAHRPNNKYAKVWNSDWGEEQVIELEWFGKGEWNIPFVKYWLDVDLLNMED